jgi:hypothetical protein
VTTSAPMDWNIIFMLNSQKFPTLISALNSRHKYPVSTGHIPLGATQISQIDHPWFLSTELIFSTLVPTGSLISTHWHHCLLRCTRR